MPSSSQPKTTYLVKEIVSGSLAKPDRFIKGWQNRGATGSKNVTFWKPIPPKGYTCLGDIAI